MFASRLLFRAEILEGKFELLHEAVHRGVARIDVLSAEFRQLIVGKEISQTEHAPARARARFENARRDAILLETISAGEAGRARADDDNFRCVPSFCRCFENRRDACAGRGDDHRLKKSAAIPTRRLYPFHGFGRGDLFSLRPCRDSHGTLDVLEKW